MCPTGKQQHESRAKAQAHMRGLRDEWGHTAQIYRCPLCGFFHVGKDRIATHARFKKERRGQNSLLAMLAQV